MATRIQSNARMHREVVGRRQSVGPMRPRHHAPTPITCPCPSSPSRAPNRLCLRRGPGPGHVAWRPATPSPPALPYMERPPDGSRRSAQADAARTIQTRQRSSRQIRVRKRSLWAANYIQRRQRVRWGTMELAKARSGAMVLQANWRGKLAREVSREKAAQQRGALKIQVQLSPPPVCPPGAACTYRALAVPTRRAAPLPSHRVHTCRTSSQASRRGLLARRDVNAERERRAAQAAALVIQARWRGKLGRRAAARERRRRAEEAAAEAARQAAEEARKAAEEAAAAADEAARRIQGHRRMQQQMAERQASVDAARAIQARRQVRCHARAMRPLRTIR